MIKISKNGTPHCGICGDTNIYIEKIGDKEYYRCWNCGKITEKREI